MKEKKCIYCKEKFLPVRFLQKNCLKEECIKLMVLDVHKKNSIKWKQEKKERKKELLTISQLLPKVQEVFNAYIRERDKHKPCISCGRNYNELNIMNAGHFKPAGTCYATRFDEMNVHGQCVQCNKYKSGNLINYKESLINLYGENIVNEIERKSTITKKFTKEELFEIEKTYKTKLKMLK